MVFEQANFFELFGEIKVVLRTLRIHLYLSTAGIDGKHSLMLDEGTGEPPLRFHEGEIQCETTSIGTLVTVKVGEKAEAWVETFSMLVPLVQVTEGKAESAVSVCGIFTTHRTSAAGPESLAGPRESYDMVAMHGTAKLMKY